MSQRILPIDLLRGLIMLFMALDHCSAMVARTHFFEIWDLDIISYPNGIWAFTRIISHFCAPGFFLLMGMSMHLFTQNRLQKAWSKYKISLYFLKRGALIILLMIFVEFPAWGLSSVFSQVAEPMNLNGSEFSGFVFPTTVLFSLGLCMILGSLFVFRNWKILLIISCLSFIASGTYISHANPEQNFTILEHILLVPGTSGQIFTIYPVLPWLGVVSIGMLAAERWFGSARAKPIEMGLMGLVFLISFVLFRSFGWGNFQIDEFHSGIEFFTLIKYPPGLSFILFTLGVEFSLLYLLNYLKKGHLSTILSLFGKTAMFFYLIHLYVYALMGYFFPNGTNVGILYLLWLAGLIPIYFACNYFLRFKKSKSPGSLWKMI